jgi:Xaa-Pro aminopeptidase
LSLVSGIHLFSLVVLVRANVELGIYVPPTPLFPKAFHNLGIRIEDQVLIGKQDPVVLSAAAPKEVIQCMILVVIHIC